MSLLEVRNLRVRFETARGWVQAVDSVSFDLDAGESLALVGESGSGKSVTAMALVSLLPRPPAVIETGEARFDGRNLLALGERELRRVRGREIGFVFQDPSTSLHPLMTVGEQLTEALRVHEKVSQRVARARAIEALAEVGIAEPDARVDSYPHELSGGMRQRALIAMALMCRPKLLIADEPTTALDVTVQAQILELLRELQRRHGLAILLITHDLGLVADFARRVHVMYAGSIVESASASELFARPAHPYTLGLLRSVPTLATSLEHPLSTIPGSAPDPTKSVHGCPFRPRCGFALASCESSRPALLPPLGLQRATALLSAQGSRRSACFESARVAAEART